MPFLATGQQFISADCAGASSAGGGAAPSTDPLAGIPFVLRWEIQNGLDNVPRGVFLDAAGTTPTTEEGDVIYTIRDWRGGGGIVETQANEPQRMMLLYGANGRPYLSSDGVDDFMASAALAFPGGAWTIFCGWKGSNNGIIHETSANSNASDGSYLYSDTGASCNANNNEVRSTFDVGSAWGSNGAWRVTTHMCDGTHAGHQLFIDGSLAPKVGGIVNDPGTDGFTQPVYFGARSGGVAPLAGGYTALMVMAGIPTGPQRAAVETYLSSLQPT